MKYKPCLDVTDKGPLFKDPLDSFFFLMLSSNRMESTDDFICFELKHSSAGNKKKSFNKYDFC